MTGREALAEAAAQESARVYGRTMRQLRGERLPVLASDLDEVLAERRAIAARLADVDGHRGLRSA